MIKKTSFQRIQDQFPAPTWYAIYTYTICIYIHKNKYMCMKREERGRERRGRSSRERQIKAKKSHRKH